MQAWGEVGERILPKPFPVMIRRECVRSFKGQIWPWTSTQHGQEAPESVFPSPWGPLEPSGWGFLPPQASSSQEASLPATVPGKDSLLSTTPQPASATGPADEPPFCLHLPLSVAVEVQEGVQLGSPLLWEPIGGTAAQRLRAGPFNNSN